MAETSSSDYTDWMAFLSLDPDPDVKRQFENAAMKATFESVMSGKEVKIEDRLIKYGSSDSKKSSRQSPEDIQAVLKQMQARIEEKKAREAQLERAKTVKVPKKVKKVKR